MEYFSGFASCHGKGRPLRKARATALAQTHHLIVFAAVMLSVAFLAMAAFYVAREPAPRLVCAVIGVISPRLAELCAGMVERLAS